MKKILLLLAVFAAYCSAGAVELTFWLGNQKITPGQTVTFNEVTVEKYEADGLKEVSMKPSLFISSDIFSATVSITATCTSGQSIQICAGGNCRGGVSVTKTDVTVRPNQKLALGFDYVDVLDINATIPKVVTVIEAEDVEASGSKVQFIIEMSETDASVSTVEVNDNIKAVDGGVAYKAEGETALTLTAISGVQVVNTNVSGEGVISVPAGIYVYSFGEKTGKLYIR